LIWGNASSKVYTGRSCSTADRFKAALEPLEEELMLGIEAAGVSGLENKDSAAELAKSARIFAILVAKNSSSYTVNNFTSS
jgi:hypothetical protein